MKTTKLFCARDGAVVTTDDLVAALDAVRAADGQVLFMHTSLSFGSPNPELGREGLLQVLYETIRGLGVPTLCVPTFTFSFCNGEDYDVARTRSEMGALNEYIRRRPEAVRSVDPLMSVALVGADRDLVETLGHASIGADSNFDKLSRRPGVKFLFLGAQLGDCFTYMHYLEWRLKVPYRYSRAFTGRITQQGRTYTDTYELFVRYRGVTPGRGSHAYAELLATRGLLASAPLGDRQLSCVAEPDARAVYAELLERDPNFFLERPFVRAEVDEAFERRKMVAL